jgi:L-ascorbate metabolism protein UlaG (beta-lactamase superfamily)
MHYNTFPVIEQDPEAFRQLVGGLARVEILEPGGTLTV